MSVGEVVQGLKVFRWWDEILACQSRVQRGLLLLRVTRPQPESQRPAGPPACPQGSRFSGQYSTSLATKGTRLAVVSVAAWAACHPEYSKPLHSGRVHWPRPTPTPTGPHQQASLHVCTNQRSMSGAPSVPATGRADASERAGRCYAGPSRRASCPWLLRRCPSAYLWAVSTKCPPVAR